MKFYQNDCCWYRPINPCCCCRGPKGDPGEPGEPGPFLSNYLEALGDRQTVVDGENFVFSIIDKEGEGIDIDVPGTTFTITKKGLYLIEWSLNLATENTHIAHVGLLQNGEAFSFSASSNPVGNFSSGALINVTDTPYTLELNNRSGNELLIDDIANIHSALSIRILRFADGPQ